MNVKSNKPDQAISAYLNSVPEELLTRAQEEVLIKNVEVFQTLLLKNIVDLDFSRNELKLYLESLDSSGELINDISKKLDDESPKGLVDDISEKFKLLIKALQTNDIPSVSSLLEEVALTGTIIHGIVIEIKKKHTLALDVESKVKSVKKYFFTEEDMFSSVKDRSESLVSRLKSEYRLSDIVVNNKLNEWNQLLNEFTDAKKSMAPYSFEEVKNIYKEISQFEAQALKFKNELITKNLRLVISRAKKHTGKGLDFADLIQEGNIGLMKAVDKFDSSKKTKISTYATWWIDQSIRRAISNKGKTVRVPTHIEWEQTNLIKLIHKMTGVLKREPTLKEISDESGIDLDHLEDLQNRAQHEIGLDEELSSGLSLNEMLPDHSQNPHNVVEQKLLREKIRGILSTLKPREEMILRLRYGIGQFPDDEGTTLQDVADQVGITKQGVRVVECTAFKKLKKKAQELRD